MAETARHAQDLAGRLVKQVPLVQLLAGPRRYLPALALATSRT